MRVFATSKRPCAKPETHMISLLRYHEHDLHALCGQRDKEMVTMIACASDSDVVVAGPCVVRSSPDFLFLDRMINQIIKILINAFLLNVDEHDTLSIVLNFQIPIIATKLH